MAMEGVKEGRGRVVIVSDARRKTDMQFFRSQFADRCVSGTWSNSRCLRVSGWVAWV